MKLLLCTACSDVFALRLNKLRSCACGKVKGQYVDQLNAEYEGEAVVLGIANNSLVNAIVEQRERGDRTDGLGRQFTAFIIPEGAKTVRKLS